MVPRIMGHVGKILQKVFSSLAYCFDILKVCIRPIYRHQRRMKWCLGDVKRKQLMLMPFSTKGVPQIPPDKVCCNCCNFYNNHSKHTSDIITIYFFNKNMKYDRSAKSLVVSLAALWIIKNTRLVYILHPLQNQSASHPLTVYVYLQTSLKLHN